MNYKSYEEYTKTNKDVFDKHVAIRHALPTGKNDCIVEFKDPETTDGAMVFIYCKGYLTIQGDYGNGSFTWYNPRNTLEWVANTGFDYFMEKIRSGECSGNGLGLMQDYDQDLCIESVKKYLKEYECEVNEDEQCPHTGWIAHTDSYFEWIAYLNDKGNEVFGDDWYECAPYFGVKTAKRAYLWKYGLQCAIKSLKAEFGEIK